MKHRHSLHRGPSLIPAVALAVAFGCSSSGRGPGPDPSAARSPSRGAGNGTAPAEAWPADASGGRAIGPSTDATRDRLPQVSTVIDARPVALLDGYAIHWADLREALGEAAGAEVLREIILDAGLDRLARERGVVVRDADLAEERRTLLASLHPDPATAIRLLDDLTRQRGLGPVRFAGLIRRTAIMRALVRDDVRPSERAVDDLIDARYGARRSVRILTTASLEALDEAVREIAAGASFAETAVRHSTDASAARGGLIAGISRRDPSYPEAIRTAAWRLSVPGSRSDPIRLGSGYAILQFVDETPEKDYEPATARAEAAAESRLAQERILMDEVARRILQSARLTFFDRGMEESWRRGPRE